MFNSNHNSGFSLKAYKGSKMTLLAMDMQSKPADGTFAGFTLGYTNPKGKKYFIYNLLNFEGKEGVTSSLDSPIQLFKWIHFPGSYQQAGSLDGKYIYEATPRYFDTSGKLLPLDKTNSVQVDLDVNDFSDGSFSVGFTRAFMKSQAFTNRYGDCPKLKPSNELVFDTNIIAGKNKYGNYTYEDMYSWLGYSARKIIYELLEEALKDSAVSVDMFAYDFNDPVAAKMCLDLASKGRIRIILDNAALHHTKDGTTYEDKFEKKFNKLKNNGAEIFRCKFARYAHCKIIILKKKGKAYKALSGSTNFSFNGLYVNANHVVVFDNPKAAQYYDDVFNVCWKNGKAPAFRKTDYSCKCMKFARLGFPSTEVNFSPHTGDYAGQILDEITANVKDAKSVLFSVMDVGTKSTGSLIKTLREIHEDDTVYSYGVTDNASHDISIYKPGSKKGILIDAKSANRELPPQFQKERSLPGHAIHHKFVVTNFNKRNARVYCGSSNLALGGETNNGDNLICIKDSDVATVFAIETLRLTDHYNYRSVKNKSEKEKAKGKEQKSAILDKSGHWVDKYYNKNDIRYIERKLFA